MLIEEFLASVQKIHKTANATEHSYRPALQKLFNALDQNVTALNEPKRLIDVGAPDFSLSRGDIVIGHCEAKDLHIDLKSMKDSNATQKKRYVGGLSNLLYTNCLEWLYFRDGELVAEVRIAEFLVGIQQLPERFTALEQLLRTFIAQTPLSITSSKALAERMAGKAVLIKDVLARSLMQDKDASTELSGQYKAFKEHLIHDISVDDFADIYAETIAYGMFAARLHDKTPNTFSRQEALDLLPKSNPFLRNLFSYIAGPDLDERIVWIIDDLARVFQAANVRDLMERYGKTTQRNDPFLHFYEDFLKAYNPEKREIRGVWYTPEPVVNFIVRAVDDVLKTEFQLPEGLADTSKVEIAWDTGQRGLTKEGKLTKSTETVKEKRIVHRVQILDPATGTGTFLAETIKQIAPRIQTSAPGMWAGYVEKDLIPRLHGFELLMASYAMCHLKLDMVLRDFDYKPTANPPRVSVYLTNSLEEGEAANQTLPFAQWLSNEVKAANTIKRDMPIMCVMGNPPYRGESTNKGEWIMGLMDAYKKEPGGFEKLNERNPKWINDDYVKFIRMSEAMIDRNGSGVLGFITNHGYLDNPTFRGMRWHLRKTFDKIYVLDLHGNSNKKEIAPDGTPDKNVFDIQQGVAIIIAVKTTATTKGDARKKGDDIPLAEVFHAEFWGERKGKYESLWESRLASINWNKLECIAPQYTFAPRDQEVEAAYRKGFRVPDLMPVNSVGIVTARDALTIDFQRETLWSRVQDFERLDSEDARTKYALGSDVQDWSVTSAQSDVKANFGTDRIVQICYRPFDYRWTYFTGTSRGFQCRPRTQVMRHLTSGDNFAFVLPGQSKDGVGGLVVNAIAGHKAFGAYDINSVFPLYLHPLETELDQIRRINFDEKLFGKIRKVAKHPTRGDADEIAVFDYIYGVLHCPSYRQTYTKFLKVDFPRITWPATPEVFWDVADKGRELRRLHLMESGAIGETPYPFTGYGTNIIEKVELRDGAIWINDTQRFDNAPLVAWDLYIGGYLPAQRWLKDRKGLILDFEDVKYYQGILKILAETDRITKTIDLPLAVNEVAH